MEKEKKILTVQCKLNDGDFEDVFRIYNETEKTSDKRFGLITCVILLAVCIFMTIVTKSFTFAFYAIAALVVGISYHLVPVNKKFIATNKLQFGEWREISFYPHSITTIEIFEKNETAGMEEEELEEATTTISTNNLIAYENMRGFLFAEQKIVNQFVYIPKREFSRQTIAAIQEFAQNNCSGGYQLLEGKTMLTDDEAPVLEKEEHDTSKTSKLCDQYYGVKKLRLYDASGQRVDVDEDENADLSAEDAEDTNSERITAPELDVEDAYHSVIAEDEEETEEQADA